MDLKELRNALLSGMQQVLVLDGGIHEVVETLEVPRSGVELRAGAGDGIPEAVLRRGQLADGSVFQGPLVRVVGQSDVRFSEIVIDGRRFEQLDGRSVDRRHPISSDPRSAEFACQAAGDDPARFDPAGLVAPFQADLMIFDSSRIHLESLVLRDAITIGIAIGPGCREIDMDRITVSRAGQFGVWIGSGLPGMPGRPLPPADAAKLPKDITIRASRISGAGAAGVSIEGQDIALKAVGLEGNHCDYPFNEAGGQVVIDYKANGVTLDECRISSGVVLERPVRTLGPDGREVWEDCCLASVGIEASGSDLLFRNLVIEGAGREAIHLDGAHRVRICGDRTRLTNNHVAAAAGALPWTHGPRQNITLTTSIGQRLLGCATGDIDIADIRCEDGILTWSDGSIADLSVHGVRVRHCDLTGRHSSGVTVLHNTAGRSLQGVGWLIAT